MIEEDTADEERLARILTALKALAEPNRLRAVAAIAERPRTGTELCQLLGLGAATVSHHMTRLERAGIVHVAREGQRRRYTLDDRGVRRLALSASDERVRPAGTDVDDASAFFSDGRLTSIPVKRKKRVAVLRRLMSGFEAGRVYSEPEVNAILGRPHDDVATLRRELVGYGFLSRSRSTYRLASELPQRDANVAQEVPPDEQTWLAALIETAKADNSPAGQDSLPPDELSSRPSLLLPQSRRRIVSSISSPRPGAKPRSTPTRRNPAGSRTRS